MKNIFRIRTIFVVLLGSFALLWFGNCQPIFLGSDELRTLADGGVSRSDGSTSPKVDTSSSNQDGEVSTDSSTHQENSPNKEHANETEPCIHGATTPCYTGPEDTRNVGPCTDGLTVCVNGVWSPCANQVLPQQEICNGKDDDCDGTIDEAITKPKRCNVPNETGPCVEGSMICKNGKMTCASNQRPQEEVCDGKDNDCDGRVDELISCNKTPPAEGDACEKATPCPTGLVCLKYGDNRGTYCHKPCTPNQPNECTHKPNLRCFPLEGGSAVCIDKACQKDSDCSFGFVCRTRTNGQEKLCVPPRPAGPKVQGEFCKTPVEKSGCRKGLRCVLTDAKASTGLCAADCSNGAPCPPYQGNGVTIPSTCMNLPNNLKFCLFLCNSTAQKCPPGMKCVNGFGNQNYCLAP